MYNFSRKTKEMFYNFLSVLSFMTLSCNAFIQITSRFFGIFYAIVFCGEKNRSNWFVFSLLSNLKANHDFFFVDNINFKENINSLNFRELFFLFLFLSKVAALNFTFSFLTSCSLPLYKIHISFTVLNS